MNKILTLYDIEFKRIYKLYFGLLFSFVFANLGGLLIALNNVVIKIAEKLDVEKSFQLLKKVSAGKILRNYTISTVYLFMNMLLIVAIIICFLYAVVIWYRDFIGKSKTSYTLFMLPNNKFDMYIAKLITVVTLIYGVMIAEILVWAISIGIITTFSNVTLEQIINIFNGDTSISILGIIRFNVIEFIMLNIIGTIILVMTVFTGVIIQKSFKKAGTLLGVAYIMGIQIVNLYAFMVGVNTGRLLTLQSITYAITVLVSSLISYKLLNKKIYL